MANIRCHRRCNRLPRRCCNCCRDESDDPGTRTFCRSCINRFRWRH